jgi:isoleucyl-tRNA synthetase
MDYSKTVNLPKTDFPMKADLPKREPEWLKRWDEEREYFKALEQRQAQKGKKEFILHDGPPYANGHLHLGHALNKILKDVIVRYKTMTGHYAPYVPGWDCHGLPIELQLMKELKISDKNKVDRAKFRAQAKAFAEKFVGIQRQEFKRLGVLGDWENPYLTMDAAYEKTIVDTFKALESKGYVYRGLKPVYWCPIDETALAEAEVEYENDSTPSIFVAFPSAKDARTSFVIWTTTPWTLPANLAIAYNPEKRYVVVRDKTSGRQFIVAEDLGENFQKATKMELELVEALAGTALSGQKARHPWLGRDAPLLPAGFVAMDTGTGLVHIAPGHGVEDYQLGQEQNPALPILSPVDDRGRFLEDFGELKLKGEHVFKANPIILDFLKTKDALLHVEEITHSYPHCWRCHKPVIFRATEQWFLSVEHENLRARLLEAINQVEWIPTYGKSRITGMVQTRPDWCLSRQRLWGTEIPASPQPSPQEGEGGRSPGEASPDIVDVWFESGVSWAAVLKNRDELAYPADMYLEGSDQHRGWFQTSLIPSVALEGRPPFKSVLTHGFVMDGEGRPMSKSLGNVIAPEEVIRHHGADVLRLWVGSSDYAGDVRLSPEILKGLTESYRKVRNTFRYLLGNLADFDPVRHKVPYPDLLEIDRWALHKLQVTLEEVGEAFAKYQFHRGTYAMVQFCNGTLSGLYFDVLKDRLYCDAAGSLSRRSAQTTLYELAHILFRLWAPVLSFTADEAWRSLGHADGVALADFPEGSGRGWKNEALEREWETALEVRERVLLSLEKARQAGQIKGNLEAQVTLHARPHALAALLARFEPHWPSLCIVSQVAVSGSELPSIERDPMGLQVRVERVTGVKCARCWIYKRDVGSDKHHPEICGRCAKTVEEWKEVHHE